jgi:hypothetical protein
MNQMCSLKNLKNLYEESKSELLHADFVEYPYVLQQGLVYLIEDTLRQIREYEPFYNIEFSFEDLASLKRNLAYAIDKSKNLIFEKKMLDSFIQTTTQRIQNYEPTFHNN